MKTTIFDVKGKEVSKIDLPKEIFDAKMNQDLLYQVVVAMYSNSRENIAHTKDRAEVSGGGKKPWRQKGTGRARHGSTRSPIWIGGGITFGPRNEKDYTRKITKKMKAKALAIVLSQKNRDGEIVFVDSIETSETKTKKAKEIMTALSKNKELSDLASRKNNTALITLSDRKESTEKSFRNISSLKMDLVKNVNILDILKYKYLIIENPEKSIEILKNRIIISKK
ncbi:MAG TPA: 50S ribosomal protein L4 [Candidatus Paceibacterota bacterium]|nr:50S ribosomal protein L4 [Candidatus Paceibacterota bacterium]HMP19198.1 50S ribosomal protein L4 [Candidatus Paceibacterota bacterium]HMP85271.1 50S ribosomal protein L4 [Candidatus Paceibacterota bacterium]